MSQKKHQKVFPEDGARGRGRLPSKYPRRKEVAIGNVVIGGDNPVAIQSMTTTDTSDVDATLAEIKRLEDAGCEMIRVSVPDKKSADALSAIKRKMRVPLIADIHFHPEIAIAAIEAGVDKVRLNPGNIVSEWRLEPVAKELVKRKIPVRIGVNSGSIAYDLQELYRADPITAIVKSAIRYIEILEKHGIKDIVVSLKSSDVRVTVESNRRFARECDYPLHIGITEAGPGIIGAARSAIGIGLLLTEGLGDTIRASLASDVVDEIIVCKEILTSLGVRRFPKIVACPTCARLEFDVIKMTEEIMDEVLKKKTPISIAIMGCMVNGPGEAEDADVGLMAANGKFVVFRKGKITQKDLSLKEAKRVLREEIAAVEKELNASNSD